MSNERIQQALSLVEKYPDNDLARFSLAQAYFDREDHAAAADQLEPLCAKKADWMVVHILLGKCRLANGQTEDAVRLFQHAHQLAVDQHHDGPREELEDLLRGLT